MPAKRLLVKAILNLVEEYDLKESGEQKVIIVENGVSMEVVVKVDVINQIIRLVPSED